MLPKFGAIAVLILTACAVPGLCSAQLPIKGGTSGAISFADARTLPASKLAERTLRMLAPAWIGVRRPVHGGMFGPFPLSGLTFVSRASSTGFPNLCQSKLLFAHYKSLAAVEGRPTSEEADWTQVRSDDIDVRLQFHATGPYEREPERWTDADERRLQHDCQELDPDKAFFRAPDGAAAWAAVQIVDQLTTRALAEVQLACDTFDPKTACDAKGLASKLRLEQLSSTTDQPCTFAMTYAEERLKEAERCQELTFTTVSEPNFEHVINVRARYRRESNDHGRIRVRQAVLSSSDIDID